MRTLARIKKQRRQFSEEYFYIYSTSNGVYQFRDSKTHMVISTAPNLEVLYTYITNLFNRHKHYDLYLERVNRLSEQGVTDKSYNQREKEFKKMGHKYHNELKEFINKYYEDKEIIPDKRTSFVAPLPLVENSVKEEVSIQPSRLVKKRTKRI